MSLDEIPGIMKTPLELSLWWMGYRDNGCYDTIAVVISVKGCVLFLSDSFCFNSKDIFVVFNCFGKMTIMDNH